MLNITTPTLLLDPARCRRNIERMAGRARRHGLRLRPHFKTHQSHVVGRWFRDYDVTAITVSSLRMAAYFAADGWTDITVAFPLNIREMGRVRELSGRIDLQLTVENEEAIQALNRDLSRPVGLYIKADAGYHRTGLGPDQFADIDHLLELIEASPVLRFRGFLAHAGHSYGARGREEIAAVHQAGLQVYQLFRERYGGRYPDLILSYGDTPTCSVMEDFSGVDEIRPGNFVFYDLTQHRIGACDLEDIAVAMVCPVVARHPERQEAVIYGGGVHFAKDSLETDTGVIYGRVVELTEDGWGIPPYVAFLKKISQEHGILTGPEEWIDQLEIGSLVGILPVHSCMTADIMKEYYTTAGERIGMMRYVT